MGYIIIKTDNPTPEQNAAGVWHNEALDAATSLLRADYYKDVEDLAADFRRAIADGEITDSESASDWLHESIDGCQRVIYTHQARCGLLVSDNEYAYEEEHGDEPAPTIEARMFVALHRDVIERLDADGVDVNDPCPELDEDEDEDENED